MKLSNKSNSLRFLIALLMFSTCTVVSVKKGWKRPQKVTEEELRPAKENFWCRFPSKRFDHLSIVLKKFNDENYSKKIKTRVSYSYLESKFYEATDILVQRPRNPKIVKSIADFIKECKRHGPGLEEDCLYPQNFENKADYRIDGKEYDGLKIFYPCNRLFVDVCFWFEYYPSLINPNHVNEQIVSLRKTLDDFTEHNEKGSYKKGIHIQYLIDTIKKIRWSFKLFPEEKKIIDSFRVLAQKIKEHTDSLNIHTRNKQVEQLADNCWHKKKQTHFVKKELHKTELKFHTCSQCAGRIKHLVALYSHFRKKEDELNEQLEAAKVS